MKFRKKPVVIEAVQVVPDPVWPDWARAAVVVNNGLVQIATLEGVMTASPGDWIIKGVQGEVYPCKPDIFEATYERVEE